MESEEAFEIKSIHPYKRAKMKKKFNLLIDSGQGIFHVKIVEAQTETKEHWTEQSAMDGWNGTIRR